MPWGKWKNLTVREDIYQVLHHLKRKWGKDSVDEVLRELLRKNDLLDKILAEIEKKATQG